MEFIIKSIGTIQADEKSFHFVLNVDEKIRPAMKFMDQFSHVLVFWWADKIDNDNDRSILVTRLPYAKDVQAGVFACRAEYRPNPILMSVCQVLNVNEGTGEIQVDYIEALDGSKLVDVKPYIPISDRIKDVRVAEWLKGWPQWREEAGEFFADKGPEFFGA